MLIVNASARNDYTCPGEMSKSFRLAKLAQGHLERQSFHMDFLDLSRLNSDHDLHIHPCKGCVSTAMPLCHWPCSCYPNHSLGLVNDWMNEIYERFAACHGVIFVTPVYWYQVPSPLSVWTSSRPRRSATDLNCVAAARQARASLSACFANA